MDDSSLSEPDTEERGRNALLVLAAWMTAFDFAMNRIFIDRITTFGLIAALFRPLVIGSVVVVAVLLKKTTANEVGLRLPSRREGVH